MIAILDLDGTLINSEYRHILTIKMALEKSGLNSNILDYDDYITTKKNGYSNKLYLQEKTNLKEKLINEICKYWVSNIENKELLEHDKLYEDVIPFLKFLKKNNIQIYYVTARQKENNIIEYLKKNNILDYATQVYVVNPKKPKEAKLNKIREIMQEKKGFIIGDTEVEFEVAEELNMDCYILNRGFRSKNTYPVRK